MTIKEQLVHATKSHLQGMFDAHIANVHVYMANPAGIGEHSDIIETIENEVEKETEEKEIREIRTENVEGKEKEANEKNTG